MSGNTTAAPSTGRVTERVITTLARKANVDPVDLEPPLYDVIDPDSLDRLYREYPGPRMTFVYDGSTVVVRPDGTVTVDEIGPPDTPRHNDDR